MVRNVQQALAWEAWRVRGARCRPSRGTPAGGERLLDGTCRIPRGGFIVFHFILAAQNLESSWHLIRKSRCTSDDLQTPNSELKKIQNEIVPTPPRDMCITLFANLWFLFVWDQKIAQNDRHFTFLQHGSKIPWVFTFSGIFKNLSNGRSPQTAFPHRTVTSGAKRSTKTHFQLHPKDELLFSVSTWDFYSTLIVYCKKALSFLK